MSSKSRETYGISTGQVFLFNINVGTAVLAFPYAFVQTGWLLSTPIIILICLISFATFTFVIEAMAIANAIIKLDAKYTPEVIPEEDEVNDLCTGERSETASNKFLAEEDDETLTVLSSVSSVSQQQTDYGTIDNFDETTVYEITEHAELGRIAKMMLNKKGVIFFYVCICLYLYGDLSVYCAAISKTLRDFTCSYQPTLQNQTNILRVTDSDPCWNSLPISRSLAYRCYVILVLLILGPFTYFDLHNTKFLQMFTLLFRVLAFVAFVTLTSIALIKGNGEGRPVEANISYVPEFFGVAIFAFIGHQALPSIITPIKPKKYLLSISMINYLLIAVFYLLICFTAAFTFNFISDVYSLNFVSQKRNAIIPQVPFLTFILPLYPLFTISTSFMINSITLRNNLRLLVTSSAESFHSTFWFQKIVFPTLTLIPILCIAISTSNVETLVSLVGNYTGILIQCVIPSVLLLYSRKRVNQICDSNALFAQYLSTKNKYKSPFGYNVIIYSILIWSLICLSLITINIAL